MYICMYIMQNKIRNNQNLHLLPVRQKPGLIKSKVKIITTKVATIFRYKKVILGTSYKLICCRRYFKQGYHLFKKKN